MADVSMGPDLIQMGAYIGAGLACTGTVSYTHLRAHETS